MNAATAAIVRRFLAPTSALAALSFAASACDGDLALKNARPRVTWVEVTPLDSGRAALTFWLQDPEGDAVDVAIRWEQGGASGAVSLAPGSPPLSGLPTELGLNTANGQVHRVFWALGEVPAGALELVFQVDDRPYEGDDGDTYRVSGVDPRASVGPVPAVRD